MELLITSNCYYRKFMNLDFVYQIYISNVLSLNNKMNIAKITTNVYDIYSETNFSTNPKTPWDE
jgi:hypothetical protein